MQLSEMMLLGDVLLPRSNAVWLDTACGCAVGRAYLAGGHGVTCRAQDLMRVWPWLTLGNLIEISYRFERVLQGHQTFEELVDYVASVEPVVQKMEIPTTEEVYAI